MHPINAGFRLMLEIGALLSMGVWGWTRYDGMLRWLPTIAVPLLAAVIWGTFAVPDDPSRSGRAPVPVPGIIRILLEFVIFGTATTMLWHIGWMYVWIGFAAAIVAHNAIAHRRLLWLLRH